MRDMRQLFIIPNDEFEPLILMITFLIFFVHSKICHITRQPHEWAKTYFIYNAYTLFLLIYNLMCFHFILVLATELTCTCSNLIIETIEKGVKYVQS